MTASVGLKQLAERLVKECGTLRDAADKIGTGHTLIHNWLNRKNTNIDGLFDVLERSRKVLKLSKTAMWDILTNGKK